ncbi:arginine--tRNA ligase [Aquisalibacillus elongatus]|uniref:Arginine--tRNA ligase n=1 Tax=Aquisalibacillus elongatus TaxID=485577 RepID=A0A3N5B0H3_9BACI|nr:arginine--tRNA ligase [Aquisalibacillus elongatus]RPF50659.1 arginyl-tRNA synthetase [Aquisalibacillus elongatus]
MKYVNDFSVAIAEQLEGVLSEEDIKSIIEVPKFDQQGDLAFPCFVLAKKLKRSPVEIAQQLADQVHYPGFEKVVADGPYVNGFLNKQMVSRDVLTTVMTQDEEYGSYDFGKDHNIVIDFSSPNIAKPFSMGHLRSTVIGNSLAKIADKCGYSVVKVNHLGDWGTQFGKLIVAYKLWGDDDKIQADPIKELLELYVKFHEEAEKYHELESKAREWFSKLEAGDKEALNLWEWFKGESLKEFSKIYQLLNVEFDSYQGEAFYNDLMDETIEKLHQNGLVTTSEGAEVVNLDEYQLPPCLLRKSDGATLYATRDLTAAMYRYKTYQFEKSIYVVGHEQSLHFNQLKSVLEKGEYSWAEKLTHVPFGFILKDGKKMSTRKGKVVLLEQVIEDAIRMAKENIEDKNSNLQDKDEVAKMVGIGAIIFHDLKNERTSNVEFSLDDMLRFEGSTGPYVQYTHARAKSILRKSEVKSDTSGIEGLTDDYSWPVIKSIEKFPQIIVKAFEYYEPSQIAKYLIDLSRDFNKYYANVKILNDDEQLESRIALVRSVTIVLKEGLRLLGIKAPDNM